MPLQKFNNNPWTSLFTKIQNMFNINKNLYQCSSLIHVQPLGHLPYVKFEPIYKIEFEIF